MASETVLGDGLLKDSFENTCDATKAMTAERRTGKQMGSASSQVPK